tara:strand:- start:673 stop:978 length:306 start_codon:yes stop_codon:yes gene_type:complete
MSIDHVAIVVADIGASVNWYIKNFNACVDYQDDTWAMLKLGESKLALTLPDLHPAHIAIQVPSLESFPEGSEVKTHRDGSLYTYIKDLDKNIIEYIYYESD